MPALAIVDDEIPAPETVRRHPEFSAGNGARVLAVEDPELPRHGPLAGAHGLICASVAAGSWTGFDPRASVLFLRSRESDEDQADLLLWAAGLPAGGRMAGLPPPPAPADVFSCSTMRFGLHPRLAEAYRLIALHGRGGRGALLCFSAGNQRERLPEDRDDLASPYLLCVGAASRGADGRERLAPYSGRGPRLDLCAPSSPVLGDRVARLFPDGPVLAGVPRHCGSFAFEPLAETRLLRPAAEGERLLRVAASADFLPRSRAWVELGDEAVLLAIHDVRPGQLGVRPCPFPLPADALIRSGTRRLATILEARQGDETRLLLDRPLDLPHLPATVLLGGTDQEIGGYAEVEILETSGRTARLRAGPIPWRQHFSLALDETHWAATGGTSTATPFVAGVASAILGRHPELSRDELADALVRTAVPLAEAGEYPGARRIDAAAAFAAAPGRATDRTGGK